MGFLGGFLDLIDRLHGHGIVGIRQLTYVPKLLRGAGGLSPLAPRSPNYWGFSSRLPREVSLSLSKRSKVMKSSQKVRYVPGRKGMTFFFFFAG